MGDTESLVKERSRALAEQYGWSTTFAEAYVKGEFDRRRGKPIGPYVMVGIDESSAGFRAGYFGRQSAVSAPGQISRAADTHQEITQREAGQPK